MRKEIGIMKKKIKNPQSDICSAVGIHECGNIVPCDICLSLVFIDPGMEKGASHFSFNQTVIGISCMPVCVCV